MAPRFLGGCFKAVSKGDQPFASLDSPSRPWTASHPAMTRPRQSSTEKALTLSAADTHYNRALRKLPRRMSSMHSPSEGQCQRRTLQFSCATHDAREVKPIVKVVARIYSCKCRMKKGEVNE